MKPLKRFGRAGDISRTPSPPRSRCSTSRPDRAPLARLNARELQILSLLGKGKTYAEIARILTLNYRSVVGTTSAMRVKLGAGSLAELIHIALRQPGAG